jgi:hypothetical protein
MVHPNVLVLSRWDIPGATMDQAMVRAHVLDYDRQIAPRLLGKLMPLIYYPNSSPPTRMPTQTTSFWVTITRSIPSIFAPIRGVRMGQDNDIVHDVNDAFPQDSS